MSSRTPRPGDAHPDHSAPGLGSRLSLTTPSVRSSPDYCSLGQSRDAGGATATVAVAGVRDLVAHGIMQNEDVSGQSFFIRDNHGATVATVPSTLSQSSSVIRVSMDGGGGGSGRPCRTASVAKQEAARGAGVAGGDGVGRAQRQPDGTGRRRAARGRAGWTGPTNGSVGCSATRTSMSKP